MFRPHGHDRLSDYAHIDERFRYVELADRTLLINSAHIVALTEVTIVSAVEGMLKMLTDASAKGLRLPVGSPAQMMDASGAPQDASSHPLTRQEILQLIGPIIPEHARRRLPQETTRRIRSRVAERRVQSHDPAQRIGDRGEHRARSEWIAVRRRAPSATAECRTCAASRPAHPLSPAAPVCTRCHPSHPLHPLTRRDRRPGDRSPVPT